MPPFSGSHIEHAARLARTAIEEASSESINEIALELFRIQAQHVPVYSGFLERLGVDPKGVRTVAQIPCLPISFFKTHDVFMSGAEPVLEFQSSGTTGMERSKQMVADLNIYERSAIKAFEMLNSPIEGLSILALLPNYLEQGNSSLIHMIRSFMEKSGNTSCGFFLDQYEELETQLRTNEQVGQRTLLIGVPYALMDLLADRQFELKHTTVMETGGMKGRREEMLKSDMHAWLSERTGLKRIHSEYGMTELLSQAYSSGKGLFECPPWMRVSIREVNDPLSQAKPGRTGGINIMDLANAHSCAFISTMDLGRQHEDARFEVLGRFDNSDVRGCNLLVQ